MPDDFAPWMGVFETLRVIDGVPLFPREHEAELHRAAGALGFSVELDLPALIKKLPPKSGRWRWVARPSGTETFFVEEESLSTEPVDLSLSLVRVGSQNWDARFKTVSYLSHAQALKETGTAEAVLLNEHRQVAGAARANIFWRRGKRLYTPAAEAGCRCGIVRGFVLSRREVEQASVAYEELLEADEIFLTNSMRGIVSARMLDGRSFKSFIAADDLRAEYDAAVRAQLGSGRS